MFLPSVTTFITFEQIETKHLNGLKIETKTKIYINWFEKLVCKLCSKKC